MSTPEPILSALDERIREAEAIIRAQERLQIAMYNGGFEVSWPHEASDLKADYETRYDVFLDGDEDGGDV